MTKAPVALALGIWLAAAGPSAAADAASGNGPMVSGDLGLGTPTGSLGATVGWHWGTRWTVAAGYGRGLTGHQIALMTRFTPEFGGRRWLLETGPSLALAGPGVGTYLDHDDDVPLVGTYHAAWWNTAVGLDAPVQGKLSWYGRVGWAARLAENMSPLRRDGHFYTDDVTAPEVVRERFLLYVGVGITARF